MLHHTRRWNRSHLEELHSAWLNGVGMLVWENVFGAWVGWNERDKALLRAMLRRAAAVRRPARDGRVDAARRGEPGHARRRLALERRRDDAVGAREPRRGLRRAGRRARGRAPGRRDRSLPRRRAAAGRRRRRRRPSRPARRCASPAPVVRVDAVPDGFVEVAAGATARDRRLPRPRDRHLRRDAVRRGVEAAAAAPARARRGRARRGRRAALRDRRPRGDRRPTAHRSPGSRSPRRAPTRPSLGARLPTEDEWQLAAEAGLLERVRPLVWNWTESEHADGRTRFAILKGGSDWNAEGSDWYVEGGELEPRRSVKLLLAGGALQRSTRIGFRLAVDL